MEVGRKFFPVDDTQVAGNSRKKKTFKMIFTKVKFYFHTLSYKTKSKFYAIKGSKQKISISKNNIIRKLNV